VPREGEEDLTLGVGRSAVAPGIGSPARRDPGSESGQARQSLGKARRRDGIQIESVTGMWINTSVLASAVLAIATVAFTPGAAFSPDGQGSSNAERFAWAESCKSCHPDIYESWLKTKHAKALDRLSSAEQQQDCVVCHTTGGGGKIERDGKIVNKHVQCEACHGAAAAHAADPFNRDGLTRTPSAAVCEGCHNDKSPRFRGFHYAGMVKLSHAK
jgi:hypothetical protein